MRHVRAIKRWFRLENQTDDIPRTLPSSADALPPEAEKRRIQMAGYGLFVLVLAVGVATIGYYVMRND